MSHLTPRAQKKNILIYFLLSALAVTMFLSVLSVARYVVDERVSPLEYEVAMQPNYEQVEYLIDHEPDFDPCALLQVYCEGETPLMIEERITIAALKSGVDPDQAITIAACESSMNPYAENPNSTAKGLYQFTDPTWEYIKARGHQFDADENIRQFMIWYPLHPEWWECE